MKVHYAGHLSFIGPLEKANVKYCLNTFYELRKQKNEALKKTISKMNGMRHSIIDSGLFTIMFGADSDKQFTEKDAIKWQDDYAEFVNNVNYNHSIVECDVQKRLSPELAWELRKKFKTQVKNQIINVYHLEDENPDKLISYADYIAVSIPELRKNVSKKELLKITDYISRKACVKGKKVHLLGCTQKDYLKRYQYCYSCDSTSWISGQQYNNCKSEIYGDFDIDNIRKKSTFLFEQKSLRGAYILACLSMEMYKKYAGDQN